VKAEVWQQLKPLFHAALDMAPAEREVFLAGACKEEGLRRQVEALLAAHEGAGDFLDAPALVGASDFPAEALTGDANEEGRAGQRIGAYEIVREIGHGGMGSVFLAVRADDQYRKQVAIKLIRRGMDTDLILRRFTMERQILANFEHPNIARLLEGGSTEDGLPYFVMEYIEGQPLTEYCAARQCTNSERLKLFREVCDALQYAHQNLVVHRDIKPSNILVTSEGVPKLLDFGIAKLLGPGWADASEATASMVRLMTPEYASPEQLRGLPITTGSDVYSLGVVLYELLTGRHPYRLLSRRPEEVADVVLRVEPEKPSSTGGRPRAVDGNSTDHARRTTDGESTGRTHRRTAIPNPKSLRGDLDNIVLKALRKEPERRYASVQEFSEDIRRHLEGLPVTASPDTFAYRARKFVRRHKAGVLAAAVVVITLLTATAITAWQARVARAERAKAEQRFNDVRKLANSMVFELHDSILDLPGSTPSRELLVSRALEYLDKLASEAGQDSSLQLELASAYDKIGKIQGGLFTSNLGRRKEADVSFRKALAIREALVAREPNNILFRRWLITSYTRMATVLQVQADLPGALEYHDKALAVAKQNAADSPNDPNVLSDLALCYAYFGYMQGVNGHTEEALENTRKAVVILEELAAADPGNIKFHDNLTYCYDRVAEVLTLFAHNHAESLALYRKIYERTEARLAAEPSNTTLRRAHAVSYYNVALVSAKLGDTKTALDSSRQSLAMFVDMLAKDPQNEEFRQVVATVQTTVCENMIKTGEAAEAIQLLNQSLLTLEKSFAASPSDEMAHFRVGNVQQALGQGYAALASDDKTSTPKRLAHWREARAWFQQSQEIYKVLREAGKITGEDGARLDVVTEEIAKCDAAIARLTQARR
jgi:non-specific serine/threonine protein kinase/serine/threonine-protein kinase